MARRGRRSIVIPLTDDERDGLERSARRNSSSRALALRFEIVLACADGCGTYGDIAARLGCSATTVSKWRRVYLRHGLEGLDGLAVESVASRSVDDDVVDAVVGEAIASDHFGETCLSSRQVAGSHGVSHTTVSEIWRAFRLTPWLQTEVGNPVDRHLESGSATVVATFADGTASAAAYVLDQRPVDPRGRPHEAETLLDLLRWVDESVADGEIVHVLLDDHRSHRTRMIQKWLLAHRDVHVHFTDPGRRAIEVVEGRRAMVE